jgi:hypothetical protein
MSKLAVMLFITAVLVGSFVILSVPAANGLTKRDCSSYGAGFCYNNPTARLGNTAVCGDHLCAPGEWDKLISALTVAQRGQQAATNMTQAGSANMTVSATTIPTTAPPNVCDTIKSLLSSAGVSSSIVTKVTTDLGCS